jgi:hypothetical protein
MESDAPSSSPSFDFFLITQTPPTAFAAQRSSPRCHTKTFSSPGLIGLIIRATRPLIARPKKLKASTWRLIMPRIPVVVIALSLAALGGIAVAAQDKYALQLPGGLSFADFRGYEDWQVVAVSQTDELLKVMVANPVMIDAYKAGVPGNGQPFPDGSKIAKIEWKPKKMTESPFAVNVPSTLQDVFLIEKDTKRFPDTKGWAYAVFDYDPASDTFAPDASGTVNCGFACHTIVASKDYIFHSYQKR